MIKFMMYIIKHLYLVLAKLNNLKMGKFVGINNIQETYWIHGLWVTPIIEPYCINPIKYRVMGDAHPLFMQWVAPMGAENSRKEGWKPFK